MKNFLAVLCLLATQITVTTQSQPVTLPVSVILDTDMDSDVDDVGALAMLHSYRKMGKVRILGLIVTSDEKYSAPCAQAINTYFGMPDLPIGVSQRDSLKEFSRYTKKITEQFPHQFTTNTSAEDATAVYRRLLSSEPDGSVVIITIGHLTSLSRLLDSGPDGITPLSGLELVAKKVKSWSCMGGQFPSGKEANFYRPDPASTVNCMAKWAPPVTFSGWEAGNPIITGGEAFRAMNSSSSPVYKAYEYYNGFKGRASWDQIAILEAVEGAGTFLEIDRTGYCKVFADGSNEWKPFASHFKHGFVKIIGPSKEIQQHIDKLMSAEAK
jgi:purine nucleosidase